MGILYKKITTKNIDNSNPNEYKISFVHSPTKFGVFLGLKPYTVTYVGSCTVWYKTGGEFLQRAGTLMEYYLCEIWETYERKKKK